MAILDVRNLCISFGGLQAVDNLSFGVEKGTVFAIVGPNGAGKSTLFNCITGVYKPDSGEVLFEGVNLVGKRADQIARLGLGRTFQNLNLFKDLTVLDNVLIGMHGHIKNNLLGEVFGTGKTRQNEREALARAEGILSLVGLQDVRHSVVRNLPYGTEKRVELARAMALQPKLLLLDEPVAGMNDVEREDFGRVLTMSVRGPAAVTILLIEHNLGWALGLADRVAVLNFGAKIAEGTAKEITINPGVIEAYLGAEKNDAPEA